MKFAKHLCRLVIGTFKTHWAQATIRLCGSKIGKIKSIIINRIHHNEGNPVVFSELLAGELHRDYSGLSKIFSSTEGITIEQYVILQKTERVKELLLYNQLTLSEIAHQMGYSSVAHLSAQFRKTTGMTPTAFKNEGAHLRRPLDNISG